MSVLDNDQVIPVSPKQKQKKGSDLQFCGHLGQGSFGQVYKAFDPQLGKVVAVKMIELDVSNDINDVLMELKCLEELRCKQITEHYYSVLRDSVLFVVMEYCAVGTCSDLIYSTKHHVFKENCAVYVLQEICKGLQYIHGQNKIHRDLKCGNIFVTANGDIKIGDFGVSAQLSLTMPERNSFMGTPYWMAPEVILGNNYDTAVDIWSLGVIGYELVTGLPPYRDKIPQKAMKAIIEFDPPPLPNYIEGLPLSLAFKKFVQRCLSKDPRRRPSASDLLDDKLLRCRTAFGQTNQKPFDFMKIVKSVLNYRERRIKKSAPCNNSDDLRRMAPAKTKHSRIPTVIKNAKTIDFDLTLSDSEFMTTESELANLQSEEEEEEEEDQKCVIKNKNMKFKDVQPPLSDIDLNVMGKYVPGISNLNTPDNSGPTENYIKGRETPKKITQAVPPNPQWQCNTPSTPAPPPLPQRKVSQNCVPVQPFQSQPLIHPVHQIQSVQPQVPVRLHPPMRKPVPQNHNHNRNHNNHNNHNNNHQNQNQNQNHNQRKNQGEQPLRNLREKQWEPEEFIHKIMDKMIKRTRFSGDKIKIVSLENQIRDLDRRLPGFTQALMEEFWEVLKEFEGFKKK